MVVGSRLLTAESVPLLRSCSSTRLSAATAPAALWGKEARPSSNSRGDSPVPERTETWLKEQARSPASAWGGPNGSHQARQPESAPALARLVRLERRHHRVWMEQNRSG